MNMDGDEGPPQVLRDAIAASTPLMPLAVKGCGWASEALTVWGEDWSFSTTSSWRLSRGGRIIATSFHQPDTASAELISQELLEVRARSGRVADDPVLEFAGDLVLEVFCDMVVEPWVLRLPSRAYVPTELEQSQA